MLDLRANFISMTSNQKTMCQRRFHDLFHGITLLSVLFFASLSHAQTTTVSNDQMSVEYGYLPNEVSTNYGVKITLKKPGELNSTTALTAPMISVPVGTKVILTVDGGASAQEESYGFFRVSRKNLAHCEILSPNDSIDENFHNETFAPNVTGIIDGDSYYEEIGPVLHFSRIPLIGSWWDNLSDDQLKKVPCIYSWSALQEGTVNLQLAGNIGCDKKESLLDYSGWKWNPKRTNNGDAVIITLELPITIVSDQDQPEPAL